MRFFTCFSTSFIRFRSLAAATDLDSFGSYKCSTSKKEQAQYGVMESAMQE
jgi:hypothetical protein